MRRWSKGAAAAVVAALSGLIALLVGQVWITGSAARSGLPTITVSASGRECAPSVGAAALVGLVVAGGVVLMGQIGRRFAAGAGAVVAAVAAVATGGVLLDPLNAVRQAGTTAITVTAVSAATIRPVVWIVLLLLIALVGVLLVIVGGARASTPSAAKSVPDAELAAGRRHGESVDHARQIWDALDQGVDPTVER